MDPNILYPLVGVFAGAIGLLAGRLIFSKSSSKKVQEAEIQAQTILKEAELRAETIRKEKELEAKEKFVQLKATHERDSLERNKKINDAEIRIRQKEQSVNQKERLPLLKLVNHKYLHLNILYV